MNFKYLVLPFFIISGLFGMDAPEKNTESPKRKRGITQKYIVDFLQDMKQNHTIIENNFMQLLTTDLENSAEKHDFIYELGKLAAQNFTIEISFLKTILPEPAKKKQKIEQKVEPSAIQHEKKLQDPGLMTKVLTELIESQQTSVHTAQGNVDLLKGALQAIQDNNLPKKNELTYSLMYI